MQHTFEPGDKGKRHFPVGIIVVACCGCLWVLVGMDAALASKISLAAKKELPEIRCLVAAFFD